MILRTDIKVVKVDVNIFSVVDANAPITIGIVAVLGVTTAIGDGSGSFMIDSRGAVGYVTIGVEG